MARMKGREKVQAPTLAVLVAPCVELVGTGHKSQEVRAQGTGRVSRDEEPTMARAQDRVDAHNAGVPLGLQWMRRLGGGKHHGTSSPSEISYPST